MVGGFGRPVVTRSGDGAAPRARSSAAIPRSRPRHPSQAWRRRARSVVLSATRRPCTLPNKGRRLGPAVWTAPSPARPARHRLGVGRAVEQIPRASAISEIRFHVLQRARGPWCTLCVQALRSKNPQQVQAPLSHHGVRMGGTHHIAKRWKFDCFATGRCRAWRPEAWRGGRVNGGFIAFDQAGHSANAG